MTREERLQKQKLCDEFITELESMVDKFKMETGIEFQIHSTHEYEKSFINVPGFNSIFKLTDRQFCYCPVIKENGHSNYVYHLNINDTM